MASTYLTRAMNGNSEYTGTMSLWLKRGNLGQKVIYSFWEDSSTYQRLQFDSSDRLNWKIFDNGTLYGEVTTTRKFRDTSAWYHIVCRVDTTQSTASDRVRFYINGEHNVSANNGFATENYPTQNRNVKQSAVPYIGTEGTITSARFDGCMSHIHYTDAASNDAAVFGETDATTGEWKIKTNVSTTYGSKGFFILKDGNSGTDHSGNSNDFTAYGTLTNTEDCPSNNFATWNILATQGNNRTMENGATYIGNNSNNYWNCLFGTLASSSGKFYCEIKDESDWGSTSDSTRRYGIVNLDASMDHRLATAVEIKFSDNNYAYAYMNASGVRHSGSTLTGTTSTHPTFQEGDIIMIAMDLDNNKLYFGKNGTWNNSANPASGATGTGSVANIADGLWTFYAETKYGSDNASANFGNGYHRTTAISSEGTNASGIGKFEYDVPAGYTALSTKGLNL